MKKVKKDRQGRYLLEPMKAGQPSWKGKNPWEIRPPGTKAKKAKGKAAAKPDAIARAVLGAYTGRTTKEAGRSILGRR